MERHPEFSLALKGLRVDLHAAMQDMMVPNSLRTAVDQILDHAAASLTAAADLALAAESRKRVELQRECNARVEATRRAGETRLRDALALARREEAEVVETLQREVAVAQQQQKSAQAEELKASVAVAAAAAAATDESLIAAQQRHTLLLEELDEVRQREATQAAQLSASEESREAAEEQMGRVLKEKEELGRRVDEVQRLHGEASLREAVTQRSLAGVRLELQQLKVRRNKSQAIEASTQTGERSRTKGMRREGSRDESSQNGPTPAQDAPSFVAPALQAGTAAGTACQSAVCASSSGEGGGPSSSASCSSARGPLPSPPSTPGLRAAATEDCSHAIEDLSLPIGGSPSHSANSAKSSPSTRRADAGVRRGTEMPNSDPLRAGSAPPVSPGRGRGRGRGAARRNTCPVGGGGLVTPAGRLTPPHSVAARPADGAGLSVSPPPARGATPLTALHTQRGEEVAEAPKSSRGVRKSSDTAPTTPRPAPGSLNAAFFATGGGRGAQATAYDTLASAGEGPPPALARELRARAEALQELIAFRAATEPCS